ncbi:uncharacterized protein MYCFIDRAFT_80326 [Pseudocercospora fijiensis CIRAD86]|uniref:PLD phosphodiesterase domain-containing protein n=1 Tax=Pseudocercospora fijiensis (strain CIRAD86) TaxID=383855 RepID=M3AZV5_PSEFD|nr:uncharacterized protein MYCFIDRAFT_80326 [Pseudocercospora fijiensis CIRAD86]EME82707.1 hypothetical protein MYCFIDRAFT_80326 [Pseudocercospora fijiensis CIRAD86]
MPDHAKIHTITFGTGHQIFESLILPAIEKAEHEVLFVTCFLVPSHTLEAFNNSLRKLGRRIVAENRGETGTNGRKKIKIRIGFSSSGGVWEKVVDTCSISSSSLGEEWRRKLGILEGGEGEGLDVRIQRKFFFPFSVWHSKFVVVDRERVFLPSCNVSWEVWLEGMIVVSGGGVVGRFVGFWEEMWGWEREQQGDRREEEEEEGDVECEFLPSPHHRNPRFALLPWRSFEPPPDTPLNLKLLEFFATAKEKVYLQTPNVTCAPVLEALLGALRRGVEVRVVTSERLMILEQLVTAGTTTDRCMRWLVRRYKRLAQKGPDEEAGLIKLGRLHIEYYVPRENSSDGGSEPVQSHLKLTVVDNSAVVFGSGNMDRASWYTSQELGVAFYSEALVTETMQSLQAALLGRTKLVFDSEAGEN